MPLPTLRPVLSIVTAVLIVTTACVLDLHAAADQADQLESGISEVDITPPPGRYVLVASRKIADSVRDPLYARVLTLETRNARIAIISLDLDGAFPPQLFDPYRAKLKREAGFDYVVFNASHTHESLDLQNHPADLRKWSWTATAMNAIYSAVLEAHARRVPVRMGVGYGHSNIGTNRRLVTPQGVKTLYRTVQDKVPVDPSDPRVGVLRLDRLDGTTLAVVVHYACHPVALMDDAATRYSADYVGEMAAEVARGLPGHPEVLFWQGAAGDINLRDTILGSGEPEVRRYGHELAQAVLEAAVRIHTSPENELSWRSETLDFASRWSPESLQLARQRSQPIDEFFERTYQPRYSAQVGTLLLGRKLALAFLPGEPFIDFQFELEHGSPIQDTWLLGYSGPPFGYLPTIRATAEGGYGGDGPETLLELGAGERMITRALVQLWEQVGKLRSVPAGLRVPEPLTAAQKQK